MTKFTDLGLSEQLLRAIADTGYDTPTPIQEQAIPVAMVGLDVLGIAQTGTGKTAAFTLPMIEKLAAGRSRARMPRAIVLEPTRELADQVSASFEKYAKGQRLSWALLIGGVSFSDQELKLDRGVDVLIATPGRLLDLFERSKVMLNGVSMMVVDEADRMLDMGFIPDIERIFKLTPPTRQTLFFSATMPPEITRLTEAFLKNPVRIEVSRPATTGENIAQFVLRVPHKDPRAKRIALRALLKTLDIKNGIVFCNRKTDVDIVAKSLVTHGFNAAPIHGDLDQSLRMKTLDSFRKGDLTLLVASDVAARGLDIPAVGHVFNFDAPIHADDYVHRIGRTGRAGRTGETYLLLSPGDEKNYDKVVKLIKKEPVVVELEVDYAALNDAPRTPRGGSRDSGRREGGRESGHRESANRESGSREPSSRSRRPDRDRKRVPHGETSSMTPIEAPVEAPRAEVVEAPIAAIAAAVVAPRERRPRNDDRKAKAAAKPNAAPVEETPFGEHMPAFMMRATDLKG